MAASDTLLRLLVILLGVSHLLSLNAIPATRIGSLMHGPLVHDQVIEKTDQMVAKESFWDEQATINGRMDVELHDYPGSGANNRHTPKPQYARCADC